MHSGQRRHRERFFPDHRDINIYFTNPSQLAQQPQQPQQPQQASNPPAMQQQQNQGENADEGCGSLCSKIIRKLGCG